MKLTTGIGINELGSMLPVVAGGGALSPAAAVYAWMEANSPNALWLDFLNYSTTFQNTAKTTPAELGDPVRTIVNLGPNAFDMSCSADAKRPVLVAGGAQSDGVDDVLHVNGIEVDFDNSTIICVLAGNAHASNNPLLTIDRETKSSMAIGVNNTSGTTHRVYGRDVNTSTDSRLAQNISSTNFPTTIRYDADGVDADLYIDGAKGSQFVSTLGGPGAGAAEGYSIFGRSDESPSLSVAATVTEAICLPNVCLTDDATALAIFTAYFQDKYGTNV
jgi:hypothetical protein